MPITNSILTLSVNLTNYVFFSTPEWT